MQGNGKEDSLFDPTSLIIPDSPKVDVSRLDKKSYEAVKQKRDEYREAILHLQNVGQPLT